MWLYVCMCFAVHAHCHARNRFLRMNEMETNLLDGRNGNETGTGGKSESTERGECWAFEVFRIIFTGRGTFIHCIIWFQYAHMLVKRMDGAHRQTKAGEGEAIVLRYHRQTTNRMGNHTSNAMAHENECRPEKWNSLHRTQIINGFAFCMCPKCYVERVSD